MTEAGTTAVTCEWPREMQPQRLDAAHFWDRIDQGRYPLRPSTDAFRMGINYLVYSMTH